MILQRRTILILTIISIFILIRIYLDKIKLTDDGNHLSQHKVTPDHSILSKLVLYVRYTSRKEVTKYQNGPEFSWQAEQWLLPSIKLFWPIATSIVIVLDDEKPIDHLYGSTLPASYNQLDVSVCYMKPYPSDVIHNWNKMRMYLDMLHADKCTDAEYVGFVDVDTLFITAIQPNLLFENKKPVVIGRIGDPAIPCWLETGEYILGVKQVMQCMNYFPVIIKAKHIKEMRKYVANLHGKGFIQVVTEATDKVNVEYTCYCHYSLMCNFVWYNYRNEYAWHLQFVKPKGTTSAMVSIDYLVNEIKPDEKIPIPRCSIHARHFMLEGIYHDANIPTVTFINNALKEGFCYSFGFKLCSNLCTSFKQESLHDNLFSFENYEWQWDDRCQEKQDEHYYHVDKLLKLKYYGLYSDELICNAITKLDT